MTKALGTLCRELGWWESGRRGIVSTVAQNPQMRGYKSMQLAQVLTRGLTWNMDAINSSLQRFLDPARFTPFGPVPSLKVQVAWQVSEVVSPNGSNLVGHPWTQFGLDMETELSYSLPSLRCGIKLNDTTDALIRLTTYIGLSRSWCELMPEFRSITAIKFMTLLTTLMFVWISDAKLTVSVLRKQCGGEILKLTLLNLNPDYYKTDPAFAYCWSRYKTI